MFFSSSSFTLLSRVYVIANLCSLLSFAQEETSIDAAITRNKCMNPFNTDPECITRSIMVPRPRGPPIRLPSFPFHFPPRRVPTTTSTPKVAAEVEPEIDGFALVVPDDYPNEDVLSSHLTDIALNGLNPESNSSTGTSFKPQQESLRCLCGCDPNPTISEDGCHNNITSSKIQPFEGFNARGEKRHIVQIPNWGIEQSFHVQRCRSGSSCAYGGGTCEQVKCFKPLLTYHDDTFEIELFPYSACCKCNELDFTDFLRDRQEKRRK